VETGSELWENEGGMEMNSASSKNKSLHPFDRKEKSWKEKLFPSNKPPSSESMPLLQQPPRGGPMSLQEYANQQQEYQSHYQQTHLNRSHPSHYPTRSSHSPREPHCWEFITPEIYILLFILFVYKTGQELSISSMPFLGKEVFQLGIEAPGYYMAAIGALVLPMNILVNQLLKGIDEKAMVINLTYTTLLGLFLICHFGFFGSYSLFQYFFGTVIIFTTLNALEGIIMALLAKLISPDLAKGTWNSGLLATEAGTLGRVVGDMTIVLFGSETTLGALLVNRLYFPLALLVLTTVFFLHRYQNKLDVE
jgi:hypothetical protein